MGVFKIYPDPFDRSRNKAWNRSRAQAHFRGEEWALSFDDYRRFWSTPELWARRGRRIDDLCMTRVDDELPWNSNNCVIITRDCQLHMKNDRRMGRDIEQYFADAIRL